ncbi:hypothetical protein [Aneurinibacillus thermoaerophilus]|nr:hypothetical protein [Aneurinibacillus thermoaerophilus]
MSLRPIDELPVLYFVEENKRVASATRFSYGVNTRNIDKKGAKSH